MVVDGISWNPVYVSSGVAQGTVLGPLMFLSVYILMILVIIVHPQYVFLLMTPSCIVS